MIVIPGLYYGQCSELCGVNHSFMPTIHIMPPTLERMRLDAETNPKPHEETKCAMNIKRQISPTRLDINVKIAVFNLTDLL